MSQSSEPIDNLFRLNNALVVPQTNKTDFGKQPLNRKAFISGIVDERNESWQYHMWKDKARVNKALRSQYLADNEPIILKGTWLYFGLQAPHFGHFLSESIHRMWAWDKYKDQIDGVIVLAQPRYTDVKNWHAYIKQVYKLLGVPLEKVNSVTQLTEVETLLVPEQGSNLLGTIRPWYEKILASRTLIKPDNKYTVYEKVFVSRRRYKLSGRVAGMGVIERLFEKSGYHIFVPEICSMEEQIFVISKATLICWEEGSAAHLLELLPKQTSKAIFIARRPAPQNFKKLLLQKYDSLWTYDNVVVDKVAAKQANNAMSLLLDPKQLLEALVDQGFIDEIELQSVLIEFERAEIHDALRYIHVLKDNKLDNEEFLRRLDSFLVLRSENSAATVEYRKALFSNEPNISSLKENFEFIVNLLTEIEFGEQHKIHLANALGSLARMKAAFLNDSQRLACMQIACQLDPKNEIRNARLKDLMDK